MDTKTKHFDRTTDDVGNIVLLEHVNVTQPDQRPTTLFYVVALGGTRDPYIFVGLENMWVNYGRTQIHMPSRDPQILRAPIGFGVPAGRDQRLWYTETRAPIPPYDGHHIEIYIADFSTPYKKLLERGLITMETGEHEWRFQSIVDPKSEKPLFEIEHEVRSLKHPLYARPLVNLNPLQTNTAYQRNPDAFRGKY